MDDQLFSLLPELSHFQRLARPEGVHVPVQGVADERGPGAAVQGAAGNRGAAAEDPAHAVAAGGGQVEQFSALSSHK